MMPRLWLAMGVGLACLVASGLLVTLAGAQASGDPAAVIAAYETARNQRDLDLALSYFADDATLTQRNTTFSGKTDIRKFLEGFSTRARFNTVSDRQVNGNRVTWTERASGPGTELQTRPPQGFNGGAGAPGFTFGVEAVVQDGKIRSLTYLPANQLPRTDLVDDGRAQLPASVGLAAIMMVLVGIMLVASLSLRRGATAASTLQGRLLQGLQGWSAARQ
jgi:SnoaL-like domain